MKTEPATMRNAIGQDVPIHLVKEIDVLRNDFVMETVGRFERVQKELREVKVQTTQELESFLALSHERYGEAPGGKKGNVTLFSYDGRYKVDRSVSDSVVFDEGFAAAKENIDRYLTDLTKNVEPEVRMIIERAFRPNKAGRISASAVLSLRSLGINDPRWIMAMAALTDSVKVMSSKAYIRVYKKDEHDNWQPVSLDFAAL